MLPDAIDHLHYEVNSRRVRPVERQPDGTWVVVGIDLDGALTVTDSVDTVMCEAMQRGRLHVQLAIEGVRYSYDRPLQHAHAWRAWLIEPPTQSWGEALDEMGAHWQSKTQGERAACLSALDDCELIASVTQVNDCPGYALYLRGTTPDSLQWRFTQNPMRGKTCLHIERGGEYLLGVDGDDVAELVGELRRREQAGDPGTPNWDVVAWALPALLRFTLDHVDLD